MLCVLPQSIYLSDADNLLKNVLFLPRAESNRIPASVFDYKKTFLLFFHMAGYCLLYSIAQAYYEGRYTDWTLHKVNQFEPALFYEMDIFWYR